MRIAFLMQYYSCRVCVGGGWLEGYGKQEEKMQEVGRSDPPPPHSLALPNILVK